MTQPAGGAGAHCPADPAAAVALAVAWTGLAPGDAVLLLAPGAGAVAAAGLAPGGPPHARPHASPHAAALRARGLAVAGLAVGDLTRLGGAGPSPGTSAATAAADAGAPFAAALLFDATLFTPAEVEDIHRLRLRRLRELLAPGGWLAFGDGETFGEPTLERPRVEAAGLAAPSAVTRRATLYTAAQAGQILGQSGFELVRVSNGWTDRQPYTHHEPGMAFVCRRR